MGGASDPQIKYEVEKTELFVKSIVQEMTRINKNEEVNSSAQPAPTSSTVPSAAVSLIPQDVQTRVRTLQADIEVLYEKITTVYSNQKYKTHEGETDEQTYRKIYYRGEEIGYCPYYVLNSLTVEGLRAFQDILYQAQEMVEKILRLFQDLKGQSHDLKAYQKFYRQIDKLDLIKEEAQELFNQNSDLTKISRDDAIRADGLLSQIQETVASIANVYTLPECFNLS